MMRSSREGKEPIVIHSRGKAMFALLGIWGVTLFVFLQSPGGDLDAILSVSYSREDPITAGTGRTRIFDDFQSVIPIERHRIGIALRLLLVASLIALSGPWLRLWW